MRHEDLLRELFPELAVETVVAIERGWDSLVLEVNGEWIFRIPRRREVEAWLETELALLPALAPTLSVPVPRYELVARDGARCAGYRKLGGAPFALDAHLPYAQDLGRQLGRFLEELHRFPVNRARRLGVPSHDRDPSWRARYHDFCAELRRRVGPLLAPDERAAAFAAFERYLSDDEHFRFAPALVHSDLGPAHVLCDGRRVTGVIDWSDVRIGDPAVDFAWPAHGAPEPLAEAALAAYGAADPSLPGRARFYHLLGPWHEVLYGQDTGRTEFVRSGLDGIRRRLAAPLAFER